jgi:hypothetical protein
VLHILICWHCNTGEWSLYVGIVTLVSGPHMFGLLHWRVAAIYCHCYTGEWSLHCGIAILVSGPHMLGLLHWRVALYIVFTALHVAL